MKHFTQQALFWAAIISFFSFNLINILNPVSVLANSQAGFAINITGTNATDYVVCNGFNTGESYTSGELATYTNPDASLINSLNGYSVQIIFALATDGCADPANYIDPLNENGNFGESFLLSPGHDIDITYNVDDTGTFRFTSGSFNISNNPPTTSDSVDNVCLVQGQTLPGYTFTDPEDDLLGFTFSGSAAVNLTINTIPNNGTDPNFLDGDSGYEIIADEIGVFNLAVEVEDFGRFPDGSSTNFGLEFTPQAQHLLILDL